MLLVTLRLDSVFNSTSGEEFAAARVRRRVAGAIVDLSNVNGAADRVRVSAVPRGNLTYWLVGESAGAMQCVRDPKRAGAGDACSVRDDLWVESKCGSRDVDLEVLGKGLCIRAEAGADSARN